MTFRHSRNQEGPAPICHILCTTQSECTTIRHTVACKPAFGTRCSQSFGSPFFHLSQNRSPQATRLLWQRNRHVFPPANLNETTRDCVNHAPDSGTFVAVLTGAVKTTFVVRRFMCATRPCRKCRMRKNDSVTHVMSKDVVKLDLNDPISTARKLFESSGIHHLPVVRGGEVVGILTWTDFLQNQFWRIRQSGRPEPGCSPRSYLSTQRRDEAGSGDNACFGNCS